MAKILIEIEGEKKEVTVEDARRIFEELKQVFEPQWRPTWTGPGYWQPTPIMPANPSIPGLLPFTVTCGSSRIQ